MEQQQENWQLAHNVKNYVQIFMASIDIVGKMLEEQDFESAKDTINVLKIMGPIVNKTVDEVQERLLCIQ
ncbi:MAG: hypothetical protein QE271_04875 [Bacteriovoracaceae bacterium]|nr:hypothetical protein [Bacteriovoracaceae bacterium]